MSDRGEVDKEELLRELGYGSDLPALFGALADAGISTRTKRRMQAAKRPAAEELLARRFIRVCNRGDCKSDADEERGDRVVIVAAAPRHCEMCAGSSMAQAIAAMREACARAGWTRICVVGGSPNARQQLREGVAPPPELRTIDGVAVRTRREAKDDLEWAHHVVIWGSTQLDHSVSLLYSGGRACTTVPRRGVQMLCRHLVEAAAAAQGRARR